MYVVRDKQTGEILHLEQSVPGEKTRKADEVYPDFDPKTMEFGRADQPALPAWFTIERGKVREAAPPADQAGDTPVEPTAPELSLAETKAMLLEHWSRLSLELRQELIPEHKVQNAALGVYDEERTAAIRDTMAAFRDEYHRLEEAVQKADSLQDLKRLRPRFPREIAANKRK